MLQHQRTTRLHLTFCVEVTLVAILCIGGCGGDRGPQRVVVSGAITYKGEPIASGKIRFVPEANSNVPLATARIAGGRYRADLHGGVPVGTHKVEIEAYRDPPNAAPDPLRIPDNYLPKRHGRESQERITIESGRREITKDFNLTD